MPGRTYTHIQFLHIVSSHHPCVLPLLTLLNRQTWRKSERDSWGHGYSCRDLVQRICNLHFKHAPKSVPGQQPTSALILVAQRPAVQRILFAFEERNKYSQHLFFIMTSFLFLSSALQKNCWSALITYVKSLKCWNSKERVHTGHFWMSGASHRLPTTLTRATEG